MVEKVDSRYEDLEHIGSGGMGDIFEAFDSILGRKVAIKLLPDELLNNPKRRERFEREARAAARLNHPNIVDIHDLLDCEGQPYVVMELLEGQDLAARLKAGALDWRKAVDVGIEMLKGLEAAHEGGIVHRDLKPSNVFLTSDGMVKILDFGLARVRTVQPDENDEQSTLTEEGTAVGTPSYMAPEQVRAQPVDARADIFSFGCILYEMLTGRRAFGRGPSAEILANILRDQPEALDVPVPRPLHDVVARCLEKNPQARYGSAAEVRAALEAIRSSGAGTVVSSRGRLPAALTRVFGLPPYVWISLFALFGLIIGYVVVGWRPSMNSRPASLTLAANRLAVAPFVNRTGDPQNDRLADLTTNRLTQRLAKLQELEVAPQSTVATAATAAHWNSFIQDVAVATKAGLILTGVWDSIGDNLELQATLTDARSGSIVRSFEAIPTSPDAPMEAVSTLSEWALMTVQDRLHPFLAWAAGDRFPRYEAYLAHRKFWDEWAATGPMQAGQNLFQAVALDPDYARPRIQAGALWIPCLVDEFHDTLIQFYQPVHNMALTTQQQRLVAMIDARLEGRWEDAYVHAYQELDFDPANERSREMLLRNAFWANRQDAAVSAFEQLDKKALIANSKSNYTISCVTTALHLLGRHDEELILARETLANAPGGSIGASTRRDELLALAALGRTHEIETVLGEIQLEQDALSSDSEEIQLVARELRAHGYANEAEEFVHKARLLLDTADSAQPDRDIKDAFLLMEERRFGEARAAFETQVDLGSECRRGFLVALGVCAARMGDRSTAMEMDARLAKLGDRIGGSGIPYSPRGLTLYRRACIASCLGDVDRAIRFLREAILEGFSDYESMHRDPDLDGLWGQPEFQKILRPKR